MAHPQGGPHSAPAGFLRWWADRPPRVVIGRMVRHVGKGWQPDAAFLRERVFDSSTDAVDPLNSDTERDHCFS